MDILENLNEKQKEAVLHTDGPLVIYAGAGSGKTRVITHRIAYLVSLGVNPREILAVTFTNKAAEEMRKRVEALFPKASLALVSTFHSACAKWLRIYAKDLGFSSSFSIYDESDSLSILKRVLATLFPSEPVKGLVDRYSYAIEKAKMEGLIPQDINDETVMKFFRRIPQVYEVYSAYQNELKRAQAMDFGDLILNVLRLFRESSFVKEDLGNKYKYILVDEFQDTNQSQLLLIKYLSKAHKNIMVVGDDDQSIYSWRGAKASQILDFSKNFPNTKTIYLEQNYRSSKTIIKASNALISKNLQRSKKVLWTDNDDGELIDYANLNSGVEEAYWVADHILRLSSQTQFNNVAIFYRTNAQSRVFEEVFGRQRIPYKIIGALGFYERAEVKDILSYLRLLANPDDNVSFLRIVNTPPRKNGDKTVDVLDEKAKALGLSLLKALEHLIENEAQNVSKGLHEFYKLVSDLKGYTRDLYSLIDNTIERVSYLPYLQKTKEDLFEDKKANILELSASLKQFSSQNELATLTDWLESLALFANREIENEISKKHTTQVSLMTFHNAKGLEFDYVFICGVEENLIPHKSNHMDAASLEEERRLFYVGLTRARKKLFLSSVQVRHTYQKIEACLPSRFLREIPREFFASLEESREFEKEDSYESKTTIYQKDHLYEGYEVDQLSYGMAVYHPVYGKGRVMSVAKKYGGYEASLSVEFGSYGCLTVLASSLSIYP